MIEAEGVSLRRGGRFVVDEVSISVPSRHADRRAGTQRGRKILPGPAAVG